MNENEHVGKALRHQLQHCGRKGFSIASAARGLETP